MSNLTKSKIAYDLTISPHEAVIDYNSGESLKFVFSSNLYRTKFLERLEDNRNTINNAISKRYGFNIIANIIADIKLYSSIEKRGFLIYKGLVKIECQEDIILDGGKMITKA